MNQKTNFYKLMNLNNFKGIRIPNLQRDYAQGRKGKEEIRAGFLNNINDCLLSENDQILDLNYVFGYDDNDGFFIPIDGQQRLTTLWLIYWYIAFINNKNNDNLISNMLLKFSYSTRERSILFCKNLIKLSVNDYDKKKYKDLKDFIIQSSWFMNEWLQDPTIQGMIRMLSGEANYENDGIEKVFKSELATVYFDKLFNDNCSIKFIVDNESNVDNDSYIKMNARGIELTNFEKLKADLSIAIGNYRYQDDQRIAECIDTIWGDFFWNLIKEPSERPTKIDNLYLRFINEVFFSFHIIDFEHASNNKDLEQFYNFINKDKIYYHDFNIYKSCINEHYKGFADFLKQLFSFLLKYYNDTLNEYIMPMWDKRVDYSFIYKIKDKDYSYFELIDKCVFFSVALFINFCNKETDMTKINFALEQWMLIVNDLVYNERMNSFDAMYNLLYTIKNIGMKLIPELLNCENDKIYIHNWIEKNIKSVSNYNKNAREIVYNKSFAIKTDSKIYDLIYNKIDGINTIPFFGGNLNLFLTRIKPDDAFLLIKNRINMLANEFTKNEKYLTIDKNSYLLENFYIYKCLIASYTDFQSLANESYFPFFGIEHSMNIFNLYLNNDSENISVFIEIIDKCKGDKKNFSNCVKEYIKNINDVNIKNIIDDDSLYNWIMDNNTANFAKIIYSPTRNGYCLHVNKKQKDKYYYPLGIK